MDNRDRNLSFNGDESFPPIGAETFFKDGGPHIAKDLHGSLCPAAHVEFAVDALQVSADRFQSQAELVGDFLIHKPFATSRSTSSSRGERFSVAWGEGPRRCMDCTTIRAMWPLIGAPPP